VTTRIAVIGAAIALSGCATLRLLTYHPARLAECPGALLSSNEIDGDFRLRMQIQVVADRVDTGYDLVVRKKDDRLILIGLTRFGAKAFSVVQDGTHLQTESALGPATVVPPVNVLRDIHRARFLGAGPAVESGTVEGSYEGETIRDTWRAGVLVRRVLSSAGGDVEIDFSPPGRALIHNRRCAYQATLVEIESVGSETRR